MGTERIGGLQDMGRRILERFRAPVSPPESLEEQATVRPTGTAPGKRTGDTAEISRKAHEMMKLRETVNAAKSALEREPAVREDRVAEVRSRLGRGYYQSPAVHGQVVDRLEDVLTRIDDL